MKQEKLEIIKTGLIVPNKLSRWATAEAQNDFITKKREFENAIVAKLGLPENWDENFKFRYTDNYVAIMDSAYYDNIVFRKMARGKEATYPADLKERLQDFIKIKSDTQDREKKAQERRDYFSNLIKPLQDELIDETQYFSYYHNGIDIAIYYPGKDSYAGWNKIGSCRIEHSGEITSPYLDIKIKYSTTIEEVSKWVETNKPYHDRLINLANQIKAGLPKEFFELETKTA